MQARSIPPAEPDQDDRRTKSLLLYRVEIFRTEGPESDTVALTDDARWRNEEALKAYGMQFGRVLECFTVNIRPTVGRKHIPPAPPFYAYLNMLICVMNSGGQGRCGPSIHFI